MTMKMRSDRAGFALPMSILVIGFMTAGVVAAFARATSEIRIVDNQRAQTAAFGAAQAGLDRYMARGRVTPADTTMVIQGADSARVRATLIRPAATAQSPSLYLVRADGSTRAGSGIPAGRRTVAQYAYRYPATMHVVAAWTSLSGLIKNGASGIISGADACGTDTLAGVALPDNTYTQAGNGDPIYGNPPIDEMGTQSQMASQIKIDWPNIANPLSPALSADAVVCVPSSAGYDNRWGPCGSWPSTSSFTDPNYWPTLIINGSSALPSNGRGILIVTGDLTFGGGDKWDGIILVGNRIVDNGSGNIAGAVLTGLNVLRE
jgi:hypothetical protein